MSRKRKPKLSRETEAVISMGSAMISEVVSQGAIPEIVIAAKSINHQTSELEYIIVSPLKKEKILYVLTRVVGLIDGSIQRNN